MITQSNDIVFRVASEEQEFNDAKILFRQYAQSLEIDLAFQGFDNELDTISIQYNKPAGALLLAYKGDAAIACAGVRQLHGETAELKRMFVCEAYRQFRIGRKLLNLSIEMARSLGYQQIRLDTLPSMTQAQNLYRSLGFYEIPAYRFNPVAGTVFMEMKL